ncbi:MAG: hypothetical protein J07HQX50_00953 [Haloquadratum sp. J07HQX50]|nr:MAG: hypothetical protein J07HQX50_00953 [Haloquadratum sp. J07HQX50]
MSTRVSIHAVRDTQQNTTLDILLHLNAWESRAVGVSGLQSNRQTTRPRGESHSLGLVAMPSGRDPYCRVPVASKCCFYYGDASRRQRTQGYRLVHFEQSAHSSSAWRSPTGLSNTSLRGQTGRLRRTVRNPFRPIPTS